MNGKPKDLEIAFLNHLIYERRLSPHTHDNYARDLRILFEHLNQTSLELVQPHHIRQVIMQLHSKGLAGRSLSRMLSAWRTFYKYLIRDHHFKHNPCSGVRVPKSNHKLPNALSPDEAVKLLEFPTDDILASRDSAMFELFYSSGLRLAELAQLIPGDIDCFEGTIRVNGKGGKMRIVPIGDKAIASLKVWLKLRDKLIKPNINKLFLSRRGDPISTRTISHRLKERARRQGINKNVHPHMLRHSFASHLLQSSGDLRAVQEMLGHAHITSTQVYTHLDFQHLTKIYDSTHPRAKKKDSV